MIVDDDKTLVSELRLLLQDFGYEVLAVAHGGQEAIEAIARARAKPDLILMDIRLQGGMDGIQTAEIIYKRYGIPIVYLTAHSDEDTLLRARATAPFGCVLKPFEEKELCSTIEIALGRHRDKESLRVNTSSLADIVHQMTDGIVIIDADAKVRFINLAATDFLDFRKQIRSPNPFPLPVVDGVQEMEWLRPNGRKGIMELRVSNVEWHGEACKLIMIRDVTAQRLLERALFQAQKLEALGNLAGGVAHDFNNFLTVIEGYVSLVRDSRTLQEEHRGMLDEVKKATGSSKKLIAQLMAFSRTQAMTPQPLNLNKLLLDRKEILYRLLGKNVELQIILDKKDGWVRGEAFQIEQVLMNLVVNARDAMPEGGRMTIETQSVAVNSETTVPYSDLRPGEYVKIMVSDAGMGMNEEIRARIFEPFFTTKAEGKGTGLGLAMCYGIVKQHKGHILVVSALGKGTTFYIYLPRFLENGATQ